VSLDIAGELIDALFAEGGLGKKDCRNSAKGGVK
jgi:hypothetical protein